MGGNGSTWLGSGVAGAGAGGGGGGGHRAGHASSIVWQRRRGWWWWRGEGDDWALGLSRSYGRGVWGGGGCTVDDNCGEVRGGDEARFGSVGRAGFFLPFAAGDESLGSGLVRSGQAGSDAETIGLARLSPWMDLVHLIINHSAAVVADDKCSCFGSD